MQSGIRRQHIARPLRHLLRHNNIPVLNYHLREERNTLDALITTDKKVNQYVVQNIVKNPAFSELLK